MGGRFQDKASISGLGHTAFLSPYAVSKHAVMGLVRMAAREAAPFGIRSNCGDPRRNVSMKRYSHDEEVAAAIAFLCSDASGHCSGMAFMR